MNPHSVLEDVFVPLYFFHRYQTEAAVKAIGGLEYNYAVKGDNQEVLQTTPKDTQTEALKSILKTVDARNIAIPKAKLPLFPPRAIGYDRSRESFKGRTGVSFDALSAAETAADMTLSLLLHPQRASRLIEQKGLDEKQLGLAELMDKLTEVTFGKKHKDSYLNTVQENINYRVLFHLMNLAAHKQVHPQVNAVANKKLKALRAALLLVGADGQNEEMLRRIDEFFKAPDKFKVLSAPGIPDGSPIGMDCMN